MSKIYCIDEIYEFQIKLEYPEEFITKVTGNYGPPDDPDIESVFYFAETDSCIRCLKFETNLKCYGPYGVERWKSFNFTIDGNKIIGLTGRSHKYLNAIGFHLSAPITLSPNPFKNGWAKVRSICIPSQGKLSFFFFFFLVQ